jgi:hypothetical protein
VNRRGYSAALLGLLGLLAGCGGEAVGPDEARDGDAGCDLRDAAQRPDGRVVGGPFATSVELFQPGPGAHFGHDQMPDIVLGPPLGAGDLRGGTDAVSLGAGGVIVLGFAQGIVDGPGPDFTVFENPFVVPGATLRYWAELGEVSVSDDGVTWATFPCDPASDHPHAGCAGATPVHAGTALGFCPLDPRVSGGDAFDLATVGLRRARFVRIRDLQTHGPTAPAAGFDLDAIAVLHPGP